MTYDELIHKITHHADQKTLEALLAVVVLHKPYIPMDNETGDYSVLAYCNCSKAFNERDAITYPCPTIQAIARQLA